MLSDSEKRHILGKLVIANKDLDSLESKLSKFNIFESIGVVRQEVRHSDFIAFLLNPSESHRLGDLFLKRLLICTSLNSENSPLSPIEIDILGLEDAEVKREWKNIDILIHSPSKRLVCAIENKVDSSEHSNQLNRYKKIIDIEFRECRKMFIYLTKEGDSASDEEWLSLNYGQVIDVIESICNEYQATIDDDVRILMSHYINLVKRHIMNNSEIAQLCQKIYKQHRQALDLIYEHRPDLQVELSEFIQKIIRESTEYDLVEDDHSKQFIRFAPKEWDDLPFQKTCHQWTSSHRILLFEFVNNPRCLGIHFVVGPGSEEVKKEVFNIVKDLGLSGLKTRKLKETKWNHIYEQVILDSSDYIEEDLEGLQDKIRSFWQVYLNHEVQIIRQAICKLTSVSQISAQYNGS